MASRRRRAQAAQRETLKLLNAKIDSYECRLAETTAT
jgi:hypothetical protein